MRIGIAGLLHESNTFTGEKTSRRHFEEAFLHFGRDIVPVWRDAHHELGGFIEGCERCGAELVPLMAASATPKGPLTRACYEELVQDLRAQINTAGPLDGLLLALHGAMVSEDFSSADSETLRHVRHVIGDSMPLILSLDMHANITSTMVRLPTATVAYRTYPHIDQRERGIECAVLASRILRGEIRPVQAACKLPMLIHIVRQYTGDRAMQEIVDEVTRTSLREGILSASVAPGYIYADVPYMGVSVVVVSNANADVAEREAKRLANVVFERRHELNAALPDVETSVRRAMGISGTVCLMDSGDNIGGGGPGDSTIIFSELRKHHVGPACVVFFDPQAADACSKTGLGKRITICIGGKAEANHEKAVEISGTIRTLSDGKYIEAEARHGGTRHFDQGPTAVVDTDDGHTVVLNSLRVMPTSLEQLLSLGIRPEQYKVIVVKGVTAPRAAYDPIASEVIAVNSPGVTQAGPESFVYRHRPKPLYPLECVDSWVPDCL